MAFLTEATAHIFRYRGRFPARSGSTPSAAVFDDTALPTLLNAALSKAAVGFIDDPLSFPWSAVDLDRAPVLIVDASSCSATDATALLPALAPLTSVDAVVKPIDPSAIDLAAAAGARAAVPASSDWQQLTNERRIIVDERRILRRIAEEVGDHAIVHRVELAAFAGTPGGFGEYLTALAEASNARPVGVWGVRTRPGAPLHHGLAVLAAAPAETAT